MVYKTCGDTIAVRLEKGEEIVSSIRAICEKEGVKAGTIQGLGAADHSVVGIFDFTKNAYVSNTFDQDMEITALIGNVSTKDGELYLHIHATWGMTRAWPMAATSTRRWSAPPASCSSASWTW